MAAFITLLQAKTDLGILDDDRDIDIAEKIIEASDIILDYISARFRPETEWTHETAPPRVRAATIMAVRCLFFDDQANPLTIGVKDTLHRMRDPALA